VQLLNEDDTLAAYAAVSADRPTRPANTVETYDYFVDSNTTEPGETMLLITSAIYVPYQHLDAVRALGAHGLELETIGLISTPARLHPASAYRQEIRSMIRSATNWFTSDTER
jgi:hypothetical protein